MKTKIRLTPKFVDGLHVIDQYGDIWDVHLIKDESFTMNARSSNAMIAIRMKQQDMV